MNLIQFLKSDGKRAVGAIEGGKAHIVKNATSVYALALKAAADGTKLKKLVADKGLGKAIDPAAILKEGRMLPPVDHPDPAHLHVTGTGLTHLGSASTRDAMHKSNQQAAEAPLTDSMKMFRMGLEGGKLGIARREIPVIVEAAFADGDDRGIRKEPLERRGGMPVEFACVMRRNAGRREQRARQVRAELECPDARRQRGARHDDPPDSAAERVGDDPAAVAIEAVMGEIAADIDEFGHRPDCDRRPVSRQSQGLESSGWDHDPRLLRRFSRLSVRQRRTPRFPPGCATPRRASTTAGTPATTH